MYEGLFTVYRNVGGCPANRHFYNLVHKVVASIAVGKWAACVFTAKAAAARNTGFTTCVVLGWLWGVICC